MIKAKIASLLVCDTDSKTKSDRCVSSNSAKSGDWVRGAGVSLHSHVEDSAHLTGLPTQRKFGGRKKEGGDGVPEDPLLLVLLRQLGARGRQVVLDRLRTRTTALWDPTQGGVSQGKGLGGRLLAGSVLGHQEGVGSIGAHGCGGSAGGAGERAG